MEAYRPHLWVSLDWLDGARGERCARERGKSRTHGRAGRNSLEERSPRDLHAGYRTTRTTVVECTRVPPLVPVTVTE